MSDDTIQYLAVYGSLAPGKPNHDHIADITGTWWRGWVEGVLHNEGWGSTCGFPGIRLKTGGPRVDVYVLESEELDKHWHRLDEFEGSEYQRVRVTIFAENTFTVSGWIYELM